MESGDAPPAKKKSAPRKRTTKKVAAPAADATTGSGDAPVSETAATPAADSGDTPAPAKKTTARKRTTKKTAATPEAGQTAGTPDGEADKPAAKTTTPRKRATKKTAAQAEPATDEGGAGDGHAVLGPRPALPGAREDHRAVAAYLQGGRGQGGACGRALR